MIISKNNSAWKRWRSIEEIFNLFFQFFFFGWFPLSALLLILIWFWRVISFFHPYITETYITDKVSFIFRKEEMKKKKIWVENNSNKTSAFENQRERPTFVWINYSTGACDHLASFYFALFSYSLFLIYLSTFCFEKTPKASLWTCLILR